MISMPSLQDEMLNRVNLVKEFLLMRNAKLMGSVLVMVIALGLQGMLRTAEAAEIPDDRYVRVTPEGNLELEGKPVRFWGFIGGNVGGLSKKEGETPEQRAQRVAQQRLSIDLWAQRIADLGFNIYRAWESGEEFGRNHDYKPGDGSGADMSAYFYHQLERRGVKLWMSSTNGLGTISAADVGIIDDPKTAEAWAAAMKEWTTQSKKELGLAFGLPRMWDPRWRALAIERKRQIASFPNHYKDGLRLGDDPQVVVWEITNERFPFRHLMGGGWLKVHPYFRNQFIDQWNDFLRKKYGADEALRKAWGFLLDGESLTQGSVMLAPLANPVDPQDAVNDTNPAIIERLRVVRQAYTRDDFNRARGEDVIAFFIETILSYKQQTAEAIRGMGKSARLSPIVFDSGNDYSIQQAYMHQFADAVSTCSYSKGMGHDPEDQRFPFYSALDHSPKTGWDVPWLEQSSAKGKAHFVYETNIDARTKYRTEYPMILAALASMHQWDIIFWHSASGRPAGLGENEKPWDGMIAIYHDYFNFRDDEVQNAAMRIAGEIFKNRLLDPIKEPTTFIFGRRSLLDPVSMDYGRSFGELGRRFTPTAYRHGVQVVIDPKREDDEIVGPSVRPHVYESNPLKPTEQISFDRKRGHVMFDAPGAVAYTGFFADYGKDAITFKQDVRFSDIEIVNPENMPYPVTENERYISLGLTTTDGQPLAQTRRALLTAASTSFNTGYELDLTRSNQGMQRDGPKDVPPREFWGAWAAKAGKTPVLVARVGVTVTSPHLDGMRYVMRDWHLREIGSGVVKNGTLRLPSDKPVFVVELTRD